MPIMAVNVRGIWSCPKRSLDYALGRKALPLSTGSPGASTVGIPVARPPPYSPGRAVFPHPVLRLYSLPRCKAKPSGKHAPTWHLRKTRTRSLDAVEDAGKLLPRGAAPLACPPIEPCERTVHRPMEKAVKRAGVPAHALGNGSGPVIAHSEAGRMPAPANAGVVCSMPGAVGTRRGASCGRCAA
jgi:hypothetical protein